MDNLPLTISIQRVSGKGRGKNLGIPTLNFEIPNKLTISYGIYAGWLIIGKNKYKTAIHFGPRPQFNETDPSLEAYILDEFFREMIQTFELEFLEYIRPIKKFISTTAMLKRIKIDIAEVEKSLTNI